MNKLTKILTELALGVILFGFGGSGALALGPETFFNIELSPAVAHDVAGRESLDIDILMTSRHTRAIGLKFSSFVGDDRGRAITKATDSPLLTIARKGDRTASRMRIPGDLADGFYRLNLIAAGTDGGNTNVLSAAFFWQVAKGKIAPLSDEEWYARSEANRALQPSSTDSNR